MRVLITRPEREAAALAAALSDRGHEPLVAPLFTLSTLPAPSDFAARLAEAQAVLLTSANGARALAESTEQRGMKILAVGDTTASTAEGLGFSRVTAASGDGAALADLVRQRVDAKGGPILHVAGTDIAVDFEETLAPEGFTVNRVALYESREAETLPAAARAAIESHDLDVVTFFSPRAAKVFAKLVGDAGLADKLDRTTAVAISQAAREPLDSLPFRDVIAASRPTRQAVLDEIDQVTPAGVQGPEEMSDTSVPPPSSPPPSPRPWETPPPEKTAVTPPEPVRPPVKVKRGIGVLTAFILGLIASAVVLAAALATLPMWPPEFRAMWRGPAPEMPDLAAVQRNATAAATTAANTAATASVEAAKRELSQRLDEIDRRVRAAATATPPASASTPAGSDPAIAELRRRLETLESRPVATAPPADPATTPAAPGPAPAPTAAPHSAETDKDLAAVRLEIATLRSALQALDQTVGTQREDVARQREQTRALATQVEKTAGGSDQKALGAARASAVIGVAARLSAALESGLPFATDLGLLTPLAQGDAKLAEVIAALQAQATAGVASRQSLANDFPAVAKAALADDLADDSFGERVLGKIRGLISLRRVGADIQGDSAEAKLARAEAALDAGDIAKAVELVKSLPAQTNKATAAWLARAEAHLTARRAVDQLAAHAVTLLGATAK